MNSLISRMLFAVAIFAFFAGSAFAQKAKKPAPGEIFSGHIEAIGSKAAISAAATRDIQGRAQAMNIRLAKSQVAGKAQMVSAAGKLLFKLSFVRESTLDYAGETLIFDGKGLKVPILSNVARSAFGKFLFDNPEIVEMGLLGGTLNASWAIFDHANKLKKPVFDGIEKIDSREVYVIRTSAKSGSDVRIKLFFDTKTFQHVRTIYTQEIGRPITTVDEGRISDIKHKLTEDFSNFRKMSDLDMPLTYKINYSFESANSNDQYEWTINLQRFAFGQELKPELFQ